MSKRYAIAFFASAMVLIGLLVGYGIYINATSSAHVAKMAASQYVRVGVTKVAYQYVSPTMYFPTVNIFSPQIVDVHFPIDGTITRIHVAAGDKVRSGQLLGEITNDEIPSQVLQAEGKVRSAEANVIKNSSLLKRYHELVERGAISGQQYDDALNNLRSAEGELGAARAYRDQLAARLTGQRLVAPFDGDILKLYYAPGSAVRAGDSLVMIGDISTLFIRMNILSETIEQFTPQTGELRLAFQETGMIDKAYTSNLRGGSQAKNEEFVTEITQIEPELSIPAHFRTVRFKINNPTGVLEPGTFYQARIFGSARRVLAVPREALLGDKVPFVYRVTADNRLEQLPVSTGIQDDEFVEVKSGLSEDDLVVISGKEGGLSPGMKVQFTSVNAI